MEKKNFNHKEIEQCKISKKPIDTTKEKYSIVVECEGNEIYAMGFYKQELLSDLIKGNLEKVSNEIKSKYDNITKNAVGKLKELFGGNVPDELVKFK